MRTSRILVATMATLTFLSSNGCRTTPAADVDLRLYVFDCGRIGFDDVAAFGLTNDETPVRELFVPCYLIDHGGTRLLWDAGLPLDYAGKGEQEIGPGERVRYERSLIDQLADINVQPEGVAFVAFSHMHFDHVGAANQFAASTLLIQRAEYEAAFEQAADYPVFLPALYEGLADAPRRLLDGDHDVFGDGTVTIVAAPGHTPGHQVLRINLPEHGPIILSGDLWHFAESRRLKRVPVFNTDRDETLRSMARVEAMIDSDAATLWIEHEFALAATLSLAPAFYD
jgi:glyoxylase-like metal-dependent hydrolase (beta-lactamase superfamily II)